MIEILQLWDLPIVRIIYDKDNETAEVGEIIQWCRENLTKPKIDEPVDQRPAFMKPREAVAYIGLEGDGDLMAFKLQWM